MYQRRGCYAPSPPRDPLGIAPKGPALDLAEPHGRARFGARAA